MLRKLTKQKTWTIQPSRSKRGQRNASDKAGPDPRPGDWTGIVTKRFFPHQDH